MCCGARNIEGVTEVRLAEALIVRWSFKVAKSLGVHKVVVENDNLQVINTLRSKESGASTFFLIIADIFSLVANFDDILWS